MESGQISLERDRDAADHAPPQDQERTPHRGCRATAAGSPCCAAPARLNREGGLQDGPLVVAAGLVDDVDRLTAFGPAILAVRWGTTVLSAALAGPAFINAEWNTVAWCGALIAYTLFRTAQPLRYYGDTKSLIRVLAELVLPDPGGDQHRLLGLPVRLLDPHRGHDRRLRPGVRLRPPPRRRRRRGGVDPGPRRGGLRQRVPAAVAPSGPPSCCWSPWSPATAAGSPVRPTASTPSPSSAWAAWPTPTRCSSRCTGSPRRLPASFDLDEVLDTTLNRLRDLFDSDAVAILLMDDTDSAVDGPAPPRRPPARRHRPRGPLRPAAGGRRQRRGRRRPEPARRRRPRPGARPWAPASTPRCGPGAPRSAWSPSSTAPRTATRSETSSCWAASSSPPPSPSTTPAGSPASAPSGPTRSAPASPGTCTTASASPSPTSPSSWTGSSTPTSGATTSARPSTSSATTCGA